MAGLPFFNAAVACRSLYPHLILPLPLPQRASTNPDTSLGISSPFFSDHTPLQKPDPELKWVLEAAHQEIARLEALAEKIIEEEGAESETVLDVYEALDALDPSTFESRASRILIGLGYVCV